MEQEFIKIQNKMREQICIKNDLDLNSIQKIAGVDLAYWKEGNVEYAVCCIVVIDFKSLEVIELV